VEKAVVTAPANRRFVSANGLEPVLARWRKPSGGKSRRVFKINRPVEARKTAQRATFALKMKNAATYFYQIAIWSSILAVILLIGTPVGRPPDFYIFMPVRVLMLALWFNVAYRWLVPLYFSGRKRAFFVWSPLGFVAFIGLSIVVDRLLGFPERIAHQLTPIAQAELPRPYLFSLLPSFLLGLIVFGAAASMVGFSAFEKKKHDAEAANRRRLEAELALLKSQINPHFLLNSLNNLYALALTDPDKTPLGLLKLSEMVAYILYECEHPRVPLARDLDFIKNYIALQSLRLPPNALLHVEMPENPPETDIEPMILIPFVENAFKHGLTTSRPCEIFISIKTAEKHLHLKVENETMPAKATPNGNVSGIGLANTRQRLEHTYPNNHELNIENDGKNHRVHLKIKLTTL
jgi:two-component system, LytTR family, sensor kinase